MFDQTHSLKKGIKVEEHSNGDILVEVEPARYELDIHDLSNGKKLKNKSKITKEHAKLAKSSLFRFDEGRDAEARLQKVLSYAYEKSEYYGQVKLPYLCIYKLVEHFLNSLIIIIQTGIFL